MEELNFRLKQRITELASKENFIHHKWFVKYHLRIIEKISMELCDIYTEADKNLVISLVYIHDFAKISNLESNVQYEEIMGLMKGIGFEANYITKIIEYLEIFEKKMEIDLHLSPIEVKIVSSADGASHLVGPFMSIYLYENSNKEIDDLLNGNIDKVNKDWERKIVLPEVKKAFQGRYNFCIENNGKIPDEFLI